MPVAITPPPTFDPAATASKLPPSLQWLGGALGSVAKDVTGAGDPAQSVMGVGNPMMAADTELSPLAQALYSRVQKVADALPEWIHPAKAMSLFKNHTAKEEMDYRGLSDLLTNRQGPDKIAKAEIQAHLAANPVPDVRVKTLATGIGLTLPGESDADYLARTRHVQPVQYSRPDLNVPGGNNYTESLFKYEPPIPKSSNGVEMPLKQWRDSKPDYQSSHWDTPNVLAHTREDIRPDSSGVPGKFLQEVQSDWHQQGKTDGYKLDPSIRQPAIDALNASQEKLRQVLLSKGADNVKNYEPWAVFDTARYSDAYRHDPDVIHLLDEVRDAKGNLESINSKLNSGVPDAPFKDSWPDLTLKKHLLDVANSPDQQWLGFTKGATQADRYNLANHIQGLDIHEPSPGVYDATVTPRNGGPEIPFHGLSKDQLIAHFGRDLTEKTLATQPNSFGMRFGDQFLGPDATVGGEGMKHFYDQVLPSRLNKILKPFGGGVEEGQVALPKPAVNIVSQRRDFGFLNPANSGFEGRLITDGNHVASAWPLNPHGLGSAEIDAELARPDVIRSQPTPTAPAWLARLTPEMKAAIQKAGLPLMTLLMSRQLDNHNALINSPTSPNNPTPQSGQ